MIYGKYKDLTSDVSSVLFRFMGLCAIFKRTQRVLPLCLAVIVLSLQSIGCQQMPSRPTGEQSQLHAQYKQGLQLFQQRKFEQALTQFTQLQAKHPDKLELSYNIGAVLVGMSESLKEDDAKRKEQLERAESHLRQVLDKGSAALRQKAHYNLGIVHTRLNQYEQALYHFERSVYIAQRILKQPDAEANHNRDLIAMLIRQRKREREELNRTRVFRYSSKIIELTASRSYDDPLRQVALRGTFTHQTTGQSYVVWGYPISDRKWQVRFVPSSPGEWSYKIESQEQQILDSSHKTTPDPKLNDQGIFQVLPSAKAGHLIVATANPVNFAWKKPEIKTPPKPKAKADQSAQSDPKSTKTAKVPARAQQKPSPPEPKQADEQTDKAEDPIPQDETILRWQGLFVPKLFDPAMSDAQFERHHKLLEALAPSALNVEIELERFIRWHRQKPPSIDYQAISTLTRRLKKLRDNPSYRWAFVYLLRSDTEDLSPAQLRIALDYLIARLAHVDAIWAVRDLPPANASLAIDILKEHDPYKQPIAQAYSPELAQKIDASLQVDAQDATPPLPQKDPNADSQVQAKQGAKSKDVNKVNSQIPATKPAKRPPIRMVWLTSHHFATGEALQKQLVRPWIGELPLPVEIDTKALLDQWWRLYISGLNISVVLERAFNDDEIEDITNWQQKANDEEKLPPHPDLASTTKPATQPAATASDATHIPTTDSDAQTPAKSAQSPSSAAPSPTTSPTKKPQTPRTPEAQRISRPFIHYLILRHHWNTFLDSFKFSGYVRPSMVTIRVPDLSALKTDAAKPQAPAQGEDKSAIQGKDKSKAQVKDKSKAGIAGADIKPETRIKWKDIAVRGFLASNGPTVLFVPPPSGIEKPPHIRWHNSRWDLEFRWFNAQTGEFLEQEVFQQVESLALTAPKAEAHVARVMVREHALHEPYTVSLPPELIKASPQMPWRASEWQLIVEAPVPPKQGAAGDHAQGANQQTPSYAPMHVPFVRTSRGYEASFNPNRQGVWSFHILHKGQKLGDLWQHPGKIQVVPSQQPAPLQRSQQAPRRLFAAGGPFFFFAQPIWDILSKTWSDGDFEQTLKQLGQQHTGASVIVAQLPELTWNRASVKGDIDANANTGTDADVGTDAADQATTRNAPSTRPKNEWDPALLAEIDRLEQRIAAIHKAGFHVALMVAPERWSRLLKEEGQERLFYLFDRLSSAYPVLWIIDYRNSEHKILPIIPALARDWFLRRHPQLRKALAQKQQNAQLQPTGYLPLVGAALGQPRSEERLKSASAFDFLWLDIDNLDKELRDFQLHKVAQPVVLTWQALLQDKSPFIPDSSQKKPTPAPVVPSSTVNDSQLLLWADFLWRSQLIGFMHTGRPITKPLVASKQTKAPIDIEPSLKAPAIMRAFFSTFDWSQLQPPSQSIQFQAHQAFAAETPANNQQQGHHIVAWINASVRQDLQIQRHKDAKLDEHRYLWLHPLTGEQPISPQLLPPTPKPDQAEKLQVPFQPAILYVFKRPPQQQQPQEQQRSKKSKQPDDLDSSQRQQIRNRLQQLQDNPLKPRKTKQRDRSGKRG